MKKLTFPLVFAFIIALIIPFSPAGAMPQNNVEGWVSWEGNLTPKLYSEMGAEGHVWVNLMVKKYSDGTIKGHIKSANPITHVNEYCLEFKSVNIEGNTAIIEGLFVSSAGYQIMERYTLVDNGEPAVGNDLINIELEIAEGVWISWFGPLVTEPIPLIAHGNIQVHSLN